MKLQESAENYLENILILTKRNGMVRSVDLANELNFSNRASAAPSSLEDNGYLIIESDGNLKLTEKGLHVAGVSMSAMCS